MNTIRKNPFSCGKDEWIVVSPDRLKRPWNGEMDPVREEELPVYDSSCYLCSGNTRSHGHVNPRYEKTFVFRNDNPTFLAPTPNLNSVKIPRWTPGDDSYQKTNTSSPFFIETPVHGACEVVVYTPKHNKLMMHMDQNEIEEIIRTWITRYKALGKKEYINHVAIFETRGKELGNSMPHPHGQIWAESIIPPVVLTEIQKQKELSANLGKNALISYLYDELHKDQRLVYQNNSFAIIVPFWANFPYETMIIPLQPVSSIDNLTDTQASDLAKILKIQTQAYAQLFEQPKYGASYMFSVHQSPTDTEDYSFFQLHFHFRTPMLTPNRQKYFAGYEENFGYQRDLTPEMAAKKLKEVIVAFSTHQQ